MAGASPERWADVERLLDEALALAPPSRAVFLEQACSGDVALRAAVERLLGAAEGADAFLQEAAPAYAAPLLAHLAERAELGSGARLGAYEVVRELGRGGMATVYLARDLKHARQVALKVLPPELALAVRTERFLREIEIASRLTHPHILAVFDSGSAEGLLYYVTPYIEGDSLRQRLEGGPLRLEDALRIAGEVAGALDYAHRRGIVHRDIKPANILFADGQAVVADFGIARAISAAETEPITETGSSPGTPGYMSPEQAEGSTELDGRSDIYSLGCVLYEMLTGAPPFRGPTAQAVLAKHLTEAAPLVSGERPDVPAVVEQALSTALAKQPRERFGTAAEFAQALVAPASTAARQARSWRLSRRSVITATAGAALLGAVSWALFRSDPARVDPNVVVVLPFRVSGADAVLREGMVDLLALKFSGDTGGLQARDTRTVLSAWRRAVPAEDQDLDDRAALRVARGLGAGRLLQGSAVETAGRLVLTATLLDVATGAKLAVAEAEGSPDSLTALVDRLAAQLVARAAGVEEQRLASLATQSLPALQAYLAGRAALRRGGLRDAVDHFDRALQLDSTFALAAMDLGRWANWLQQPERQRRGEALACQYRDRLSPRDRLLLPERLQVCPTRPVSMVEELAERERNVAAAPDRAEEWLLYGTWQYLFGPDLGLSAPDQAAATAFRRALDLDPSFDLPLFRLVEVTLTAGDTAEARRLLTRYLALPSMSESDFAPAARWRVAVGVGDTAELAALRARFDSTPTPSLMRIIGNAQIDGRGLDDAERAARSLANLPATRGERWRRQHQMYNLELNRGRPGAALAISHALREVDPVRGYALALRVLDGLYWNGDTTAAAAAAVALVRQAEGTISLDAEALATRCIAELWRVQHDERSRTDRVIDELRRVAGPAASTPTAAIAVVCVAMLEAERALQVSQGVPASAGHVLDSVVAVGGPTTNVCGALPWLCLVARHLPKFQLARVREAEGDLRGALAMYRRRLRFSWTEGGTRFLSTYLRQEGRLAALTGDRAGAIRAYRHYLALRSDPEPSVLPEVERVRAELARLMGEQRNH